MKLSFRRQFLSAAAAQLFSLAVTIALQLLIVPILIWIWGVERYGVWLLISAVPAYFSLLDMGFAQVSGNEMTMRLARGDRAGAVVAAQTAWFLSAIACCVILAATVPLALVFDFRDWFLVPSTVHDDITFSAVFLIFSILVSLVFGVVSACLRAFGLSYLMITANTIARLTMFLGQIVVAYMGGGLLGCAIATFASNLAVLALFSYRFFRTEKDFLPRLGGHDGELIKTLTLPSLSYLSFTLSRAISVQGVALTVGSLLGPSAVVVTSSIRTFTQLGRTAAQIVPYAMEPIFAQLHGNNDIRSRTAFRRLIAVNAVFIGMYVLSMFMFGNDFIEFWTQGAVVGYNQLLNLGVLAVAIEIMWFTLQTPYVATNKHSLFAWFLLVASAIMLVSMQFTLPIGGIMTVGWTWVCLSASVLIFTLLTLWINHRRPGLR